MRLLCVQHMEVEGPGLIRIWAGMRGFELEEVRLDVAQAALPELTADDAVVVMGGPMGVGDRGHVAWLDEEIRWLARQVSAGVRVFGVCLGAQLIAAALGAEVRCNAHKEIGWLPVRLTGKGRASPLFAGLPDEMTVLQWHGDTFEVPPGAEHLACSAVCANQAFALGERVVALQFHMEAEPVLVANFVRTFDAELAEGGFHVQSGPDIIAGARKHVPVLQPLLYTLLDRWAGIGSETSQPSSALERV